MLRKLSMVSVMLLLVLVMCISVGSAAFAIDDPYAILAGGGPNSGSYKYWDGAKYVVTSNIQDAYIYSDNGVVDVLVGGVRVGDALNCSLSINDGTTVMSLNGNTMIIGQDDRTGSGPGGLWFMNTVFRRNGGVLNALSSSGEGGVYCLESDAELDNVTCAYQAILCESYNQAIASKLTVHGNVLTTANIAGNTAAISAASQKAQVFIEGDVTAANAGVANKNGGQVTIDGKMTVGIGKPYVQFWDNSSYSYVNKTAAEYDAVSSKIGYRQYSGGSPVSYVWVKGALDSTEVVPTGLAKPTGLKLTAKKASWKNVANNNGYTLKLFPVGSKKAVFTVQVKKNKTSYTFTKAQLKKVQKGRKYKFTLLAKGTPGKYSASPTATSKAVKLKK